MSNDELMMNDELLFGWLPSPPGEGPGMRWFTGD